MIMFLILFRIMFIFQKNTENHIFYSPIIFLNIYELCYATGADSLGQFFGTTIRLQFQAIMIYFILISIISRIFKKK